MEGYDEYDRNTHQSTDASYLLHPIGKNRDHPDTWSFHNTDSSEPIEHFDLSGIHQSACAAGRSAVNTTMDYGKTAYDNTLEFGKSKQFLYIAILVVLVLLVYFIWQEHGDRIKQALGFQTGGDYFYLDF